MQEDFNGETMSMFLGRLTAFCKLAESERERETAANGRARER